VLEVLRGVDAILHAGDIHDLSLIDQLSALAPTYAARGNGDDGSGGRPIQPFDSRLREAWLLEFDGLSIGITHDMPIPQYPPNLTVARAMQRHFGRTGLDVVVYGDTHVEAIDVIDGTLCVNPGSPTYPHNLDTRLGTLGFLDIVNGRPEATIWQLTPDGVVPFDWANSRRPW
ncbi:MAG: metallophosphoesterase family protein, partial [Tepidiformaceae bacterium]